MFLFSYYSLVNNKTYDLFWIKSIQKKLYFKGLRNIWQYNNDCVVFDEDLLYKPKQGDCFFSNAEFKTKLTFKDEYRINSFDNLNLNNSKTFAVLGDSMAMGWGVNNHETFSSQLEKKLNQKVYNFGVSSYGTVREIKRLKKSKIYNKIDTIIIQYDSNDLNENENLDFKNIYKKNDFKNFFDKEYKLNKFKFFLKTYKSSLRLFFSDIIDKLNPEDNYHFIDFEPHRDILEKIIYKNLNYSEKRIIVIFIMHPNMKILNFPSSKKGIEYKLIQMKKSDFFIIDDHLNPKGHLHIATEIYDNL